MDVTPIYEVVFKPQSTYWRQDGKWNTLEPDHPDGTSERHLPDADRVPMDMLPGGRDDRWYFDRGRVYPVSDGVAEELRAAGHGTEVFRRTVSATTRTREYARAPTLSDAFARIAALEQQLAVLTSAKPSGRRHA